MTRMCDMDESVLEIQSDANEVEMGACELNVMKDYVDDDESAPSSPDDPFNVHSSESDVSDGKHRRKKFTLASHITIIEDSSPVCYCCTVCQRYFSHKHTARNHEFCGSGKKPFKCKLCDKRFVKRGDRDNHNKIHTGEKPYVCGVCDKSFYLRHKLLRHIRSHTGGKGDFQCAVCSRSFICREALRKHQVNKHNPNKSIQCKNCEKSFGKLEERQKHKCNRPQKKKKLVCEVCGKTFSKSWNLNVHLRIHVGQRAFKCTICNNTFRLRHHLERHSTKHQADADFECMLCKQTFGRKDNMIRHLKLNHPDRHLGIDIKDIVQRSEKAKFAKSKNGGPSKEATVDGSSTEKIPEVLPVDNLPNIRFARKALEMSKAPEESPKRTSNADPPKQAINLPLSPSIPQASAQGPSSEKSFKSRIEKSGILHTVIKSGTSSVLQRVDTLRFVKSTVVERVNHFKPSNIEVRKHTEPQPSVLVFSKTGAASDVDAAAMSVDSAESVLGEPPAESSGTAPRPNDVRNRPIEEPGETLAIRGQQVSVLRFCSRDPNTSQTN